MDKNTWDLKHLMKSEEKDFTDQKLTEIKTESYKFIDKWKDRNDYLSNPQVLYEAIKEYESWATNYGTSGNLGYYFSLKSHLDESDTKIKAICNQIHDFSTKIENDIQFFMHRISKISFEDQTKFLDFEKLSEYKHMLEKLFQESKYLLSEPEEKILNLKSLTSYSNWTKMTSTFLSKEEAYVLDEKTNKKLKKNFSEISSLMSSTNKEVRKSAKNAFDKIQKKYSEVAEHEINSILQNKKIDDELRNFSRPDTARHLSDDISTDVVDAMIDSVSKNFKIAHDYYELKAKLFKVKKLDYEDRNVPYGEIEKSYAFEKSTKLVKSVFNNLDKEFFEIFECFINNGQVDVFPKKAKSAGAFCTHGTIKQPTYILLNHTNKLNDVLTLAHELGHGINNEFIKKSQGELNFDTPLSTAEVASTFMEDFVLGKILKTANDEERLSIMMMKLNDDISTIFRQVACYKFEQELHFEFRQKGYLPKEEIGIIFKKHMNSYMGEYVDQPKGTENWWVYWSHIRSFFYVYSYASGLLISKSLQNKVKKDKAFILKVKTFLSAGLSKSPKDIFKDLGIDISQKDFWNNGIEEVSKLLTETEALAKKLKKI